MIDVWIFLLVLVSFIYLFVCVDSHGGGIMAKIKNFLFNTAPEGLKRGGRKVCGDRFVSAIEGLITYVCFTANPIVQILYLVLAFGGFYCYVSYGFIHLPGPHASEIHVYLGSFLMMLCYGSYFAACCVEPGQVHNKRETILAALKLFKYDGVLFEKKKTCSTCKIEKPARSKHCSMCGFCVQRFDHHCVWINQCVGLHNYKYFLSFLILHAILCSYGFFVGIGILRNIASA